MILQVLCLTFFAVVDGPALAQRRSAASPVVVRLAVSARANKRLLELRLRRLLAIELEDVVPLAREPNGPLGDDAVRVWIDVPSSRRAVIEVRRTSRALARRSLSIAGLPSDVAARVVAIATGEMVRVQALAPALLEIPKKPNHAPPPAPAAAGLATSAGMAAGWLPASTPGWLLGPELSVEHRRGWLSQTLSGRWLFGTGELDARWFELGAGIDARWGWSGQDLWRLRLGLYGAAAALSLPAALTVDGTPRQSGALARGALTLGVERRLARSRLGLTLQPGATLSEVNVTSSRGATDIGGFSLGASLYVMAEPIGELRRSEAQPPSK